MLLVDTDHTKPSVITIVEPLSNIQSHSCTPASQLEVLFHRHYGCGGGKVATMATAATGTDVIRCAVSDAVRARRK